jgi:Ca2+-binding EF-hand superfamily protein
LASLISGIYDYKIELEFERLDGNLENGHFVTVISKLIALINSPVFREVYIIASRIPMERQAETPAAETPAAETPAAETPAAETPAAETPAAETPAADTPAAETPAADTPAAETPAAETPAAETPAAETPAAETPAAETPAAETPAAETPAADTSAADTLAADTPVNNLSQEEINEIYDLTIPYFGSIDLDKNDKISLDEREFIATLMSGFGYPQSHLNIESMSKELDPSGRGWWSLADFKRVLNHYPRSHGLDWWLTVTGPIIGFTIPTKELFQDLDDWSSKNINGPAQEILITKVFEFLDHNSDSKISLEEM